MIKLVNINGTYINPDTVVCIENVDNEYQGQYVAITTIAGPEMISSECSEAHQIHLRGIAIKDIVDALNTGKGTKSNIAPKKQITAKSIDGLF